MKKISVSQKIMLGVNALVIMAIFALNYVYQSNGFDFTLKKICSGGFATLGLVNLVYAIVKRCSRTSFYVSMSAGLVLAMLGDILIGYDFIIGAGTFALGHISFVVAYVLEEKFGWLDFAIGGVFFAGATIFLLFCPWLTFDEPVFQWVCVVYALIISLMLGKAWGNMLRHPSPYGMVIAVSSSLFFFSDLMLVFDWFIGRWQWTDHACMGTYYPALCGLAFAMLLRTFSPNIKKS